MSMAVQPTSEENHMETEPLLVHPLEKPIEANDEEKADLPGSGSLSDNLEASEEELLSDEDVDGNTAGNLMWRIVRDDDEPMEEPVENPDDRSAVSDDDVADGEDDSDKERELVIDESGGEVAKSPVKETERYSKNHVVAFSEDDELDLSPQHGLPPKLVIPIHYLQERQGGHTPVSTRPLVSPTKLSTLVPHWTPPAHMDTIVPPPRTASPIKASPFPSPLRGIPPLVPMVYTQTLKTLTTAEPHAAPDTHREPAHFPPKTVRRVMTFLTSRQDIRVSHPAVDAVAIALECFVRSFTQEAWDYTQKKKRNVLRYDDLVHVGNHYANLYFLQDFLPEQETTGYVVRKVLEESGVGFPERRKKVENEVPEENQKSSPSRKSQSSKRKLENGSVEEEGGGPVTLDGNPLVESAMILARKWDADPKFQNWRTMTRHSGRKGK